MNTNKDEKVKTVASNRLNTGDLALVALFAAVMAVCSWITVPAAVPFTLQTMGVFLAVGLLGGKRGTISVLVYLFLGAIGLPVFSGFAGGLGYMMGATGGYIIGFLFSALIMWFMEKVFGRDMKILILSMVLGLILCYAFGTAWFMTVYSGSNGPIDLATALGWCVFPFIIPDAIKIAVACLLIRRLRPAIHIDD
ncbi:MAG: biotin transporter BioY [Firmicutes bacterium]|nr:biotin transporter BioY [Bacillota bacterium]